MININNFEEEDSNILEELESFRKKQRSVKSINSIIKKKNKYEWDEFFIGS